MRVTSGSWEGEKSFFAIRRGKLRPAVRASEKPSVGAGVRSATPASSSYPLGEMGSATADALPARAFEIARRR